MERWSFQIVKLKPTDRLAPLCPSRICSSILFCSVVAVFLHRASQGFCEITMRSQNDVYNSTSSPR